jgi:hypothetical protein
MPRALLATFGRANREDLADAIHKLLELFVEWGPLSARAAGVDFPSSLGKSRPNESTRLSGASEPPSGRCMLASVRGWRSV